MSLRADHDLWCDYEHADAAKRGCTCGADKLNNYIADLESWLTQQREIVAANSRATWWRPANPERVNAGCMIYRENS